MNRSTADILADANWFPLRYDPQNDAIAFARIPAEMHRALTFIADFRPTEVQSIPRVSIGQIPVVAPMHIILHSGLGGSTLLARALAQPGVVTTLKEPPILTDVTAFGLQASGDEARSLLELVGSLLARPFSVGETTVCKMSSVGNGLAGSVASMRPGSRILCLQTPLEQFLASLAAKGAEGRTGGRRLFVGLQNARMAAMMIPEPELPEYGDLKLAALAWLSIQRMIVDAGARFGPASVRSLDSDALLSNPRQSLTEIANHFGLRLDIEARLVSGVFSRHAKTGAPFNSRERAVALGRSLADHGAEIFPIVDWARKVSDAIGIAWDLPYPMSS